MPRARQDTGAAYAVNPRIPIAGRREWLAAALAAGPERFCRASHCLRGRPAMAILNVKSVFERIRRSVSVRLYCYQNDYRYDTSDRRVYVDPGPAPCGVAPEVSIGMSGQPAS